MVLVETMGERNESTIKFEGNWNELLEVMLE
jgi:hypothetical protein